MQKTLPVYPRELLIRAKYQVVASPQGIAQLHVDLRFGAWLPPVVNPSMALGLLLDRSGSMTPTYDDGHVYDAANAVMTRVGPSGFEIGFYDLAGSFPGHVGSSADLARAVSRNHPNGGGTAVTDSLREMFRRLRAQKRDVYLIVVTDGEFADKNAAQAFIVNELLPAIPADRQNAVRLHFIGAGEDVDAAFLRSLESVVANKGVPLVRAHHHTHIRNAHTDITTELETVYLGIGTDVRLEDRSGTVTRAGLWNDGPLHEGASFETAFLPRAARFVIEYDHGHPDDLALHLSYRDGHGAPVSFELRMPLPAATRGSHPAVAAATAASAAGLPPPPPPLGDGRGRSFLLPWQRDPAVAEARRAQRAHAQQVRAAEMIRQAADLNDLARGGIPSSARTRLSELRADRGAFTSDLAPEEIGLLREKGYRPRGLVTGSAMYHVGIAYASSTGDCEVRELSQAYNKATELAVGRMYQEVIALGAHGAVGVRMTMVRHEWADKTVEVQIVGTAVDGPGPAPKQPWLSDLSGQEWWALQRAGYDAVGLVFGHCTWFVLTTYADEQLARMYYNQELVHHSRGLSRARHLAMNLLTAQARAVRASGVTGMHIARHTEEVRLSGADENPVYEYEHHNVTLSIVGTAIRLRADAPERVVATTHVLSLRDNRIVPIVVKTAAAADFE